MPYSTRPAEFLYENLVIETNVIHAAKCAGVKKLLFLGSSCIYPRMAEQPMKEEALLTGALEPTNEWYAIAKIAGIKLCAAYRRQYGCDFVSVMPTNLYGPGDRYDAENGHVVAALIMKIHAARMADSPEVQLWGSGTPRREFLLARDSDASTNAEVSSSGIGDGPWGPRLDMSLSKDTTLGDAFLLDGDNGSDAVNITTSSKINGTAQLNCSAAATRSSSARPRLPHST